MNRHNRQDVLRRNTPQDRPNILDLGGGGSGTPCPCDCLPAGGALCSTRCPNGAPQGVRFTRPIVAGLWEEQATVGMGYDEACCWESDDEDRECGDEYAPDQYFWQLCLEDDCCGNVQAIVKYTRRSGSACDDLEIVYRSRYPWRCLCTNAVFLDPQRSTGLADLDLPCTICLEPVLAEYDCATNACTGESPPPAWRWELPPLSAGGDGLLDGACCAEWAGHWFATGLDFAGACFWQALKQFEYDMDPLCQRPGSIYPAGHQWHQYRAWVAMGVIVQGAVTNYTIGLQLYQDAHFGPAGAWVSQCPIARYALVQNVPFDCLQPVTVELIDPDPSIPDPCCAGFPDAVELIPIWAP